jgi:transposase
VGGRGGLLAFAWVLFDMTVQVVTRREGAVGFEVQPRRRVVERTFAWLTRWRRLNRSYEHTPGRSEAVVPVALLGIMARRDEQTLAIPTGTNKTRFPSA